MIPLSRRLRQSEVLILKSVVKTLLPGNSNLPTAEYDVDVSAPVYELIYGAPRRTRLSIRLALWALELSPPLIRRFGRFSRLVQNDRERLLGRFESSRVSLMREMLAMLKVLTSIGYGRQPAVQNAIGYSARCATSNGEDPSRPVAKIDPEKLGSVDSDMEFDAVVVGSGAGGAVVAHEIASLGHSVAIIEDGSYYDSRSFSQDPIFALSHLYRDNGLTSLEGQPIIPMPVGRCVGGTTLINSGTCFRAPESLLENWRNVYGIDCADPDILDPIFERLERELLVQPVDTETMGRNGQLCMEGAESIGASGAPIKRYANGCTQCSSCPSGCPIDVKQATHVSYVPKAIEAGAELFTETKVDRVVFERGRATGVTVLSRSNGEPPRAHSVSAKRVVLAGGSLGTPEILFRSGLGKRNENIGKNLRIHPASWVGARYSDEVRGWDGVMQSYYVDEWHDRGILLEATFTPLPFAGPWLPGTGDAYEESIASFGHVASIGVHLSDRSSGSLRLNRRGDTILKYSLDEEDVRRILFGIARAADIHFAAGALEVYPHLGTVKSIKPGQQHDLENSRFNARDLKLEAFHPMGTARFGPSPDISVTDRHGMFHGVENLYVSDASLFPTSLGVNPMLTIMAFASHLGRSIGEQII